MEAYERLVVPPEVARAALGAMKQVALADGALERHERALLEVVRRALGVEDALEAIGPMSAEETARRIRDPQARERVVQALLILALMDGVVRDDELRAIDGFAQVLGVAEPRLRAMHDLVRGNTTLMWLRLARKSWARKQFEDAYRQGGLASLWKIVGPLVGRASDPELARKYLDLGRLPDGTLGREYWRFVVDNGFGFPGETRAVAEAGLWHDMTHVLAGYGADPDGEMQIVAFIAGYRRDDPFFWLFTDALHWQMGVQVSPYSKAEKFRLDPAKAARAFARGAAMNRDLSAGWDPWAVIDVGVAELRERYAIPPLAA